MSDDQLPDRIWAKLSEVAVKGAQYDSRERQPHPKCLEGTRVDLLKYIDGFLDDTEKNQLIWLHGTAGVGKSAVAFTVAEKMKGLKVTEETSVEKRLAGTFFFSRKHTKRCMTGYFFATLVYQLGINFPSIQKDVSKIIRNNPALLDPDTSLCDQMEALFLRPLQKLKYRLCGCPPLAFVIDALDECISQSELTDLILFLARALRDPDLPVIHILLTSRSESHISEVFRNVGVLPLVHEIPVKTSGDSDIISLDGADVDEDICTFLRHSFKKLESRHPDFPQPSEVDLAKLASRAGRRFIVATTMIKFIIDDEDNDPHDRLQLMLKLTSKLLPGTEVYKLYDCILSTCADPKRAYLHLSLIAALTDPLPISEISTLLGSGLGRDVKTTLIQLRSVVDIPTDGNLPVTIYHSSIRDYVSDPSNCGLPQVCNIVSPHTLLACSSLHLMEKTLASTALLDVLSELKMQCNAMQTEDPCMLKDSLAFLVRSRRPLSAVICMLWLRGGRTSYLQSWLQTVDGHTWLRIQGGRQWLMTQGGQEWLKTPGGRQWLQTQGGREWLQSWGGLRWLQTGEGRGWLQTQGGQGWLQTQGGQGWLRTWEARGWLQTQGGRGWLQTRKGREWLKTEGREWLQTWEGREWLVTVEGREWVQIDAQRDWLQTEGARDWLPTEEERDWLETEGGHEWLHTEGADWLHTGGGGEWLHTEGGRDWLQTEGGRYWLQNEGGRDWLDTWEGQAWLDTWEGQEWVETWEGREWLETQRGLEWLETEGGREWLDTEGGREWLETEGGEWLETWLRRKWLKTDGGRDWLEAEGGRGWLQTWEGGEWLVSVEGQVWLHTKEGRNWLKTEGGGGWQQTWGREWLATVEGRNWLHTMGGRQWLMTEGGRGWLQTWEGGEWLVTMEGREWLMTVEGREWLVTEGGRGWLQTWEGGEWLVTIEGCKWLQTVEGRKWLHSTWGGKWLVTMEGREWLQTMEGLKWLMTEGGQVWLQTWEGGEWLVTMEGREWLMSVEGREWLMTEGGRNWLHTQGGRNWLQTHTGHDWLQTQGGREWLQTPRGQAWQSTPAASVWVATEEFSRTSQAINDYIITSNLPAFQVIQQFKTLPDFLMFPVFLLLRHQHHPPSALPEISLPPGREIIHATNAFEGFANKALERSRTASNALKYACHNWAVHLLGAPNPWDDKLNHIFQAFWNDHIISWLEMEWCSKGLRSCLDILSEGQKFAKFVFPPDFTTPLVNLHHAQFEPINAQPNKGLLAVDPDFYYSTTEASAPASTSEMSTRGLSDPVTMLLTEELVVASHARSIPDPRPSTQVPPFIPCPAPACRKRRLDEFHNSQLESETPSPSKRQK